MDLYAKTFAVQIKNRNKKQRNNQLKCIKVLVKILSITDVKIKIDAVIT